MYRLDKHTIPSSPSLSPSNCTPVHFLPLSLPSPSFLSLSLLPSTLSQYFLPPLIHLPSLSALLLMLCFRQHCRLIGGNVHSPFNRQLRLVSQLIPLVPILNLQNSVQKTSLPHDTTTSPTNVRYYWESSYLYH